MKPNQKRYRNASDSSVASRKLRSQSQCVRDPSTKEIVLKRKRVGKDQDQDSLILEPNGQFSLRSVSSVRERAKAEREREKAERLADDVVRSELEALEPYDHAFDVAIRVMQLTCRVESFRSEREGSTVRLLIELAV